MKNDVQFEKNDMIFNYRVAIIIKNDGKILVQKDDRASHYTLPGGRWMIENFFVSSFNGKKYHEILMIHEYELNDRNLYNQSSIANIEEKKKAHLTYIWLSIDELKNANFKPEVILDMIKKDEFQHYIFD